MKTKVSMPHLMYAASLSLLFGLSSCVEDWGQADPPAGTDKYPKLEQVAAFDFEEDLDPQQIQLAGYSDGNVPEIVADETLESNVLHLNGGYAKLFNPFSSYQLQSAASMTFLVKQQSEGALIVDEEGNAKLDEDGNEQYEAFSKDLSSALVCFQNANATQSVYITPNGGLVYDGVDGEITVNDASEVTTGLLDELGEWHYVALSVTNDGYTIYVDGNKRVDQTVTNYDCSKIVQFISESAYAYVGYGAEDRCNDLWIDDLKFYRNELTSKQTADPRSPSNAEANFEYISGDITTTVGESDCTSGFWTLFSNYYRIPENTTMRIKLINHTAGTGNWQNWNICLATDVDRNATGYSEYLVLRSDLYGWGNSYASGSWSSTGYPSDDAGWEQFRSDMEGATVVITISRDGSILTVDAVETCLNGTVYHETFTTDCGVTSDVIRAFLVVDGSYLEILTDECEVVTNSDVVSSSTVGESDCSAGFWTMFSDYFKINPEETLHLNFTNHTAGSGNWQNWNLCVSTDAERNGTGYSEYLVLRSDLYGWGNSYASGSWSSVGYPGDDAGWELFRQNMEGADVVITIARNGANVTVDAVETCLNGTVYNETFSADCGEATDIISAFLLVDGSYLELNADNCYTTKKIY